MGMGIPMDEQNQLGFEQMQQQAPMDNTAYTPQQFEGGQMMDQGFADQFAQQYQDMPPELLQQLSQQGIDPAMDAQQVQGMGMDQGMGMEQQEVPDPVTTAMMLTFNVYEEVLQNQELNLDVRAQTANTLATALKTLSDIQNVGADQQQGVPPELQFQMDMQRMEMQMQAEERRLEMETQRLQMELEYKTQELQLKLDLLREQAAIKMEQESLKSQMDMERKQDEHILNMAQKEDEANVQSARSVDGEEM